MDTRRDSDIGAGRAAIATLECRVGWVAVVLGALALAGFAAFKGDEHRLTVLLVAGLLALTGGGLLVVAGRMLRRPGRLAIAGQVLLLLFAVFWTLLVVL